MNAQTRVVQQGSLFHGVVTRFHLARETVGLTLLVVAVLFSAVTVVYVKNVQRNLYSQLELSHIRAGQLLVEAGQLRLEQSTWATPSRIQQLAQQDLSMQQPKIDEILTLLFY